MPLSRQLHAASLPFVTRALRGGRKLRYIGAAVLLAMLSVVIGLWLALGSGTLEHELRVGFKLERPMYLQAQQDFKIFAETPEELRSLQAAVHKHTSSAGLRDIAEAVVVNNYGAEMQVVDRVSEALDLVTRVRHPNVFKIDADLRDPAEALLARHDLKNLGMTRGWDRWSEDEMNAQLRVVLARDLIPEVTTYASPLTVADAIRVTGLVAGTFAMLLLMLFAPVLAGTQMAQEVHENTLQPLTGTALSARQLVLGMTLGPAAVIALLAAPQLLLFLAAAASFGHILPALGFVAVCLASGAFLTMFAQLAGLALGRQRSSGMLGVTLLALLAPLTMLGAVLALELPARGVGVLGLLPQGAASHMLLESFLPAGTAMRCPNLDATELASAQWAVTIGALGMLCFAWLGLRALERRVGELSPTALSRGEALLGALVSIVLVTLANPYYENTYSAAADFYLLNFGFVLVPMAILLMMRVPMAETPTALRRVPVGPLMVEFAAGLALFFAVCVACMGVDNLDIMNSPVALAYLAWTITVAGLLTLRVAALPMSWLAKLWVGVCALALGVSFVHTVQWTRSEYLKPADILGFWQVSPLLGVLQAVMLVLIPAALLRALRHPASTTPTES